MKSYHVYSCMCNPVAATCEAHAVSKIADGVRIPIAVCNTDKFPDRMALACYMFGCVHLGINPDEKAVALLDKGHKIQPYCGPKEKDIDAADDSPGI